MDEVDSVTSVSFKDRANQLDDLMVGFITKQTLQKLEEEVEPCEIRKFYTSVREFFVGAASYIAHEFDWNDPILKHSCFVDFDNWKNIPFQSVEYFVSRFQSIVHHQIKEMNHTTNIVCIKVYQEVLLICYSTSDLLGIVLTSMNMMQGSELMFFRHKLEKQRDSDGKKKFGL